MTKRGLQSIKKIVKEYWDIDGASRLGAYRDAVTDLLHVAFNDKILNKEDRCDRDFSDWDTFLFDSILGHGHGQFWEEKEQEEMELLARTPDKELLCLRMDDFNFTSTKELFEKRLKGED
jgi:hypothetical protein